MQLQSTIVWTYAAIIALGGVMGFATARSVPSLIAGVVSGVILAVAGMAIKDGKSWGLPVALVTTAALLVFFGTRFLSSGKIMPGGLTTVLSLLVLIALIVTARR